MSLNLEVYLEQVRKSHMSYRLVAKLATLMILNYVMAVILHYHTEYVISES